MKNNNSKNHAYYNIVKDKIIFTIEQVKRTSNNVYLKLPYKKEYTLTQNDISLVIKSLGKWQAYNVLGVKLGLHKTQDAKKCKHLDECILGLAVSEYLISIKKDKTLAKKLLDNNTAYGGRIASIKALLSNSDKLTVSKKIIAKTEIKPIAKKEVITEAIKA